MGKLLQASSDIAPTPTHSHPLKIFFHPSSPTSTYQKQCPSHPQKMSHTPPLALPPPPPPQKKRSNKPLSTHLLKTLHPLSHTSLWTYDPARSKVNKEHHIYTFTMPMATKLGGMVTKSHDCFIARSCGVMGQTRNVLSAL